MTNIAALMERGLSQAQSAFLRTAGAVAARRGTPLFLVGGSVRDLLLGRPVLDLDLVVEGDASSLATRLATEQEGRVTARSQFGTVKLQTATATVDIATARSESYARPGALPTVQPGPLAKDLARRDFSVNALAVHLSPNRFGELVDLFGGANDLHSKFLRVLHDQSFVDDATRALRGIRYEARLDFRLAPSTETLARRDAHYLETISPDRLRRELERLFQEPQPERCLARAHGLGVLEAILPGLAWPPAVHQSVAACRASQDGAKRLTPRLFLALLAWPLTDEQADSLVQRLNLSGRWRGVVWDASRLKERLPKLGVADLSPSSAYGLLKALEPETIQAALLASAGPRKAQSRLQDYLDCWRHLQPHLTARRLLALRVPEGPLVGRLLERLLDHRLDHPNVTAKQEEAMVHQWLEETSPPTPSPMRRRG